MTSLSTNQSDNPFDIIRHHDKHGNEFWLARELMPLLGYPRWNEFKASIEKAKIACQNSQNNVVVHFSASILKNAKGKPSGAMESLSNPVLRWEGFCDRKDVTI